MDDDGIDVGRMHIRDRIAEDLHTPAEVGVDAFQADRSPTHMYRTASLAGLWNHRIAAAE